MTEKSELIELVMNSTDVAEADLETKQANLEREMDSGGILFTSTEDALVRVTESMVQLARCVHYSIHQHRRCTGKSVSTATESCRHPIPHLLRVEGITTTLRWLILLLP